MTTLHIIAIDVSFLNLVHYHIPMQYIVKNRKVNQSQMCTGTTSIIRLLCMHYLWIRYHSLSLMNAQYHVTWESSLIPKVNER